MKIEHKNHEFFIKFDKANCEICKNLRYEKKKFGKELSKFHWDEEHRLSHPEPMKGSNSFYPLPLC